MKKICSLLLLAGYLVPALGQVGQTSVLFPIQSMFGGAAYGKTITVTAVNTIVQDGYNLNAGTYWNIPSTGTNPIVPLYPNSYLLTIQGVANSVRFSVPASTNVLNLVTNGLITSGSVIYLSTNSFVNINPTNGVYFITNTDGSISIGSSGGTANALTNGAAASFSSITAAGAAMNINVNAGTITAGGSTLNPSGFIGIASSVGVGGYSDVAGTLPLSTNILTKVSAAATYLPTNGNGSGLTGLMAAQIGGLPSTNGLASTNYVNKLIVLTNGSDANFVMPWALQQQIFQQYQTSNTVYVATNGNDATAVVGDSTHPCATLTNAYAIIPTNGKGVIWIGSGQYSYAAENFVSAPAMTNPCVWVAQPDSYIGYDLTSASSVIWYLQTNMTFYGGTWNVIMRPQGGLGYTNNLTMEYVTMLPNAITNLAGDCIFINRNASWNIKLDHCRLYSCFDAFNLLQVYSCTANIVNSWLVCLGNFSNVHRAVNVSQSSAYSAQINCENDLFVAVGTQPGGQISTQTNVCFAVSGSNVLATVKNCVMIHGTQNFDMGVGLQALGGATIYPVDMDQNEMAFNNNQGGTIFPNISSYQLGQLYNGIVNGSFTVNGAQTNNGSLQVTGTVTMSGNLNLNGAASTLNIGTGSQTLFLGGGGGNALNATGAAIRKFIIGPDGVTILNYTGTSGQWNTLSLGKMMFDGDVTAKSFVATNGFIYPSNTWSIVTFTNGMGPGDYRSGNSNGYPIKAWLTPASSWIWSTNF